MLEYKILSSNGFNIYKVRFEGKGKDLKAYCTCPAGKKGGKFCKHISSLLNKDTTNIVEPSDKIEALDDVLQGSPLLSKNEDFINKREQNWFIYNTVKICSVDDLYNYLKTIIDDKIIIENDKEKKRVAVYKAEYKKDGSPKYVVKNRITFMKYSEDLSGFNVDRQNYAYFAHAGHKLIENVKGFLNLEVKAESFLGEAKDEKRPEKTDKISYNSKKLFERTQDIFDEFYVKLKDRQKLLFECGLPENHFIKFGAVPINHPQKVLMNILKKYENFGIQINAEMKIKIRNEFYELVNEKYSGYPNIDKTILPDNNYEKNDNDKAREKIEDFLNENMNFLIDAFMRKNRK